MPHAAPGVTAMLDAPRVAELLVLLLRRLPDRRHRRLPDLLMYETAFHSGRITASLCAAAALLLACTPLSAQSPAEADSSRSAADGAYTDDQAKRGQVVFGSTCGNCHGITEFNGPTFRRIWKGRTVYDMFDQLRNTMPL